MTTMTTKVGTPMPEGLFCPQPPVAVDCPDWCQQDPGHAYTCQDAARFSVRTHALTFGHEDDAEFLDVGTNGTWRGDHEELNSLDIRMWLDGNGAGPPLTAERARRLARLLLDAAAWVEAQS